MTFDEARKIAENLNRNINACHEYESAFHFFDSSSDADGDSGVVVLKKDGKTMHFVQFLLDYSPEKKFIERGM